jgi:hypothetical protein
MNQSGRQTELEMMVKGTLDRNPELKEALDLFQIGQAQYIETISSMSKIEIISTNTSNQGEIKNAQLDCN